MNSASTLSDMGSLLKKGLAWVIVIAVAILAFKLIIAAIAGLFQILFALVLIGLVVLAVVAMPHTYTENACERQFRPVPECSPCDGNESLVASSVRPMTAAAEQITSRP